MITLKAKVINDCIDTLGRSYKVDEDIIVTNEFAAFRYFSVVVNGEIQGMIKSADIDVIGLNDAGQAYVGGGI